ncbi:RmlC-like cupin domain-containing protein [Coniochaeta sp. 2T2.1]|nr:RmlC-like cupin domain-containing protein [Coniochaeta sp. 2T2.1]
MSLGQNTGPVAGVTPTTPASDRPTVPPGVGDLRGDTGLLGGNTPDPPPNADSAIVPNPELVNGQEADARLGLFLDFNSVDAPQPIRGEGGQTDPGPRTYEYEKLNPDTYAPPGTDAGSVPQNMWNMGMSHTASSLMLKGCVRLAAVNGDGKNFVDDVCGGDVWFFPAGVPHSIQALGEGAEFLLVFDEGDFDEDATFLASELFLRNPIEVLSKNFKANVSAFDNLPSDQLYIFNGTPAPANISEQDIAAPNGTVKDTLSSYTYHWSKQEPHLAPGGTVKIIDSTTFPIASNFAAALVVIHPGAMRELHWHTPSDEYAYFIQGTGRITVFTAPEASRTFDFTPNGVGYIPQAASHYIENTGTEDLVYLEVLQSHRFTDISVAQWLALSPRQMVKDTLHLPDEVIDRLPRSKEYVIAGNMNLTALAGGGKAYIERE